MSETFNKNELKKSFNRYYKFYRMKSSPKNKNNWNRFTFDKQNIEAINKFGISILGSQFDYKPYPYKPYFIYIIIWSFMSLWKWIKKTEPKLKKIQNSAFFAILLFISMFLIKHYIENEQKDKIRTYEQELKLKDQTILNYKAFSDSLLIEIKKMELAIEAETDKETDKAHPKDSTLKHETD